MRQRLRIRYLDPRTLNPHPLNPRSHPDRQRTAVTAMLQKFGWVVPAIWNKQTHHLIDGHLRRQIVLDGLDIEGPVPVVIVSWTEEQERDFMFGLGRTQELAEWRDDFLVTLLATCQTPPPGWTDEDLQRLQRSAPVSEETCVSDPATVRVFFVLSTSARTVIVKRLKVVQEDRLLPDPAAALTYLVNRHETQVVLP